jgi:hypothetical protein
MEQIGTFVEIGPKPTLLAMAAIKDLMISCNLVNLCIIVRSFGMSIL